MPGKNTFDAGDNQLSRWGKKVEMRGRMICAARQNTF